MSTVEDAVETGYQPPAGFVEDNKDPLIDLRLTDSTELWLIQWPINQPADFDGQQVSLNLNSDGHLGTFGGSSGKSYEVVNFKSQGPETTVFLSSPSEARIAGKITRRVSLINYPEPGELKKLNSINLTPSQRSSGATSTLTGRHLPTPTRSIRPGDSRRVGGTPQSSRNKAPLNASGSAKPLLKRKRANEQNKSADNSAQSSGKGSSLVTTESVERSEEKRAKKKKVGS